jgi:hypothetical protein
VKRPTANAQRRRSQLSAGRDESGSVLILVIAILVSVGLLVGALAGLATPIFAQAEVTRNLNDTGAAIDAGIEHGIQTIQSGLLQSGLVGNPAQCPPQLNNAPKVNGLVPIVTCVATAISPGISQVVLTSSPPLGGYGRVFSARAVLEVNTLPGAKGATTILSWKTCQETGPC